MVARLYSCHVQPRPRSHSHTALTHSSHRTLDLTIDHVDTLDGDLRFRGPRIVESKRYGRSRAEGWYIGINLPPIRFGFRLLSSECDQCERVLTSAFLFDGILPRVLCTRAPRVIGRRRHRTTPISSYTS
jgi:hypothetical protein